MRPSGNRRGDNERGLAGHRNAHALKADDTGDHEQAVGVNKIGYEMHEY